MQIQLKQVEIVEALRQYIIQQGLDMSYKTIEVSFTAGRNGSGLSADIYIQDNEVVGTIPPGPIKREMQQTAEPVDADDAAPEPNLGKEGDQPVNGKTSLFN